MTLEEAIKQELKDCMMTIPSGKDQICCFGYDYKGNVKTIYYDRVKEKIVGVHVTESDKPDIDGDNDCAADYRAVDIALSGRGK